MPKDLERINKIKKWLEDSFTPGERKIIIGAGYAKTAWGNCRSCLFSPDKNGLYLRCGQYAARILGVDERKIVGKGCAIIFQTFDDCVNRRRTLKI